MVALRPHPRSTWPRARCRSFLTVFVGVPLLRAVPRAKAWRRSLMLGAAVPMAFAPFVSLPGDYYEMGSILVSRTVAALVPGFVVSRWRSDDLVKLVGVLAPDARATDAAGVGASLLVAAILALATYWSGVFVSDIGGRGLSSVQGLQSQGYRGRP